MSQSPRYGGQNTVDRLRRVLVRRPDESFAVDDPATWNYASRPDLPRAQAEHDALVATLEEAGCEVIRHDAPQPGRADAIFVCDPAILTDRGAVLLRMGKDLRRGEEDARRFEEIGVPIAGRLEGDALAEAGDLQWLDEKTLAAGVGFRTNAEGVRQLRALFGPMGVEVLTAELPYFTGPAACLHLRSMLSVVDHDLAVIYSPLMSVPFRALLEERGFGLVEVPEEEFATMAPNVLALAPRKCLMLEGNSITRGRLEKAGCEVLTYRGDELSLKAEGGATCLTQPILRTP